MKSESRSVMWIVSVFAIVGAGLYATSPELSVLKDESAQALPVVVEKVPMPAATPQPEEYTKHFEPGTCLTLFDSDPESREDWQKPPKAIEVIQIAKVGHFNYKVYVFRHADRGHVATIMFGELEGDIYEGGYLQKEDCGVAKDRLPTLEKKRHLK